MAAVEVPRTLEYRGGQLNAAHVLEVENFTNWKKRFMCHIIDGQKKPENQWIGDERKTANLDQRLKSLIMIVLPDDQMNSIINFLTTKSTWDDLILYKALMNELVNDDIKLSNLEINIGFIKGLPKKWLSFCQSLKNTNNVKDSELASLFGKLKYEENLIDNSHDDEDDIRSSHEYLNDLEEEYQARALLVKSKRFFKKGTQRFSSAKPTDQTECHKCGKKGHFHKPELRPTKDFEDKYNKVKDKLALLSSSASASKASMVNNKGLIVEAYEWDKEVSPDDNKIGEVKVLMALAEENDVVSKEGARNDPSSSRQKDLVFVNSLADDTKVTIPSVERLWLSEAEGFILPNHDTGRILLAESQRNTTDLSVAVTDSSVTDYDSADESSVCSTPLPPLKKLDAAEPIFGPKTIKSILRSKSTFKAEALKGVIINEPSPAPAKGNKSSSTLKVHSAPAGKLKSVKIKDDPPLAILMKELNNLKLQFSKNHSSYSRSNQPQNVLQNKYKIQFKKSCDLCGLNNHLSENCYKVLFCKRYEKTDHKTCDHVEYISTMNMSQHLKSLGRASSRSKIPRPSKRFFPPCTHCGYVDHLSNECFHK
ncbi:hypothetical protein Tco_0481467, partial [Tanacetum coccineum]